MSETLLSFKALKTAVFIESCFAMAGEWSLGCLSTLLSSFLLRTERVVEAALVEAATPATGAPTTIPTPVREAAIAPEDRAAATAPRPTAE